MIDLNALTADTSTTSNISPNVNAIASSPFARDLWHDHFAFLSGGHVISDHQVTTDGSTWTDSTLDLIPLFMQKESSTITILDASQLSRRFTISAVEWSMVCWYEIGVGYSNPFSQFEIYIETSNDKTSWSDIHRSTITSCSNPYFLKGNSFNGNKYLRFTFTKKTNTTTGTVAISCIKAYTSRKANQGRGIEYEYPYDWNANRDIYPHSDNLRSLGLSNKRWKNVYATTFHGALSGNASTATKATQDASGNVITNTYATKTALSSVSNLVGNKSVQEQISTALEGTMTVDITNAEQGSATLINADTLGGKRATEFASSSDLNTAVEGLIRAKIINAVLSLDNWSSSTPSTQTKTAVGVTPDCVCMVDLNMAAIDASSIDAIQEAWAHVDKIITSTDQITAYCYGQIPDVHIPIKIVVFD